MRKTAVLLAILMAASSPAFAKAKKAKVAKPAPMTQNEASWALVKEGFPLVLPAGVQFVYFTLNKDNLK